MSCCLFTVTKLVPQVSPTACPVPVCASDPDLEEESPNHQFKSPQNRLPRLLLSESIHPLLNPPSSPPAHTPTRTYTQTMHMHHTHGTQIATRAVLPGTLRETPPGAGPSRRSYHHPAPCVRFPLPAATIASSFIYLTLCFSESNRAPV